MDGLVVVRKFNSETGVVLQENEYMVSKQGCLEALSAFKIVFNSSILHFKTTHYLNGDIKSRFVLDTVIERCVLTLYFCPVK